MMEKIKINEVIVVEGKHDLAKLETLVEADILITNGSHLSFELIELLKTLQDQQGVIILTDSDTQGKKLRHKLHQNIPTAKHAVLVDKQKKPGVEHATDASILNALMAVKPLIKRNKQSISYDDYLDLGLSGKPDSKHKREKVTTTYHLPLANGKQLYKYLNMLSLTKKDIEQIL
jgi:ribonuclease M5